MGVTELTYSYNEFEDGVLMASNGKEVFSPISLAETPNPIKRYFLRGRGYSPIGGNTWRLERT